MEKLLCHICALECQTEKALAEHLNSAHTPIAPEDAKEFLNIILPVDLEKIKIEPELIIRHDEDEAGEDEPDEDEADEDEADEDEADEDEANDDDGNIQNPRKIPLPSSKNAQPTCCQECHISCSSFKHLCIHYTTQHKLPRVPLIRLTNHVCNRIRNNYVLSFKCNFCQQRFTGLLSLRQHKKKIHKSQPHKYDLFKQKFSQLYFLKRRKFKTFGRKVKEGQQDGLANEKRNLATEKTNSSFQNENEATDNDDDKDKINKAKINKREQVNEEDYQERKQLDCENLPEPSKVNFDFQTQLPETVQALLPAQPTSCLECHISCASSKHLCLHYSTQHNLPNVALTRLQNYELTRIRRNSERIVTRSKNNSNLGVELQKKLSTGQNLKRNKSAIDQLNHFKCNICQKTYSTKPHLKRHKLALHEGFRYKCDRCQKEFSQSQDLRAHVLNIHDKIHYKCDQCPLKYALKSSLKKHKLAIHDGVRFKCDICFKDLCTSNYLGRHMVTVHGVILQRKYRTVSPYSNN